MIESEATYTLVTSEMDNPFTEQSGDLLVLHTKDKLIYEEQPSSNTSQLSSRSKSKMKAQSMTTIGPPLTNKYVRNEICRRCVQRIDIVLEVVWQVRLRTRSSQES